MMIHITTFDWTDASTSTSIPTHPLKPWIDVEEDTMSPTAVPTRITIDFRDAVHPSRTWILGLAAPSVGRRVELLAFDGPSPPSLGNDATPRSSFAIGARPTALAADCACPAFCERDHANE
jgi:hypothetical protein